MNKRLVYSLLVVLIIAGSVWQTFRILPGLPEKIPVRFLPAGQVPRELLFLFPCLMALAGLILLVRVDGNSLAKTGWPYRTRILALREERRKAFYPVFREILLAAVLCVELLIMLGQKVVHGSCLGRVWDKYDRINLLFILILAVFFAISHSTRLRLMLKEAESSEEAERADPGQR